MQWINKFQSVTRQKYQNELVIMILQFGGMLENSSKNNAYWQ